MKLAENDIKSIEDYFADKPVLKAYLFGSYSRGEAAKDSDVDILVELDYSKHIGMGFVTMRDDLETKLKRKIDLVSARGVSEYILPFIEQDKILIYEKPGISKDFSIF